MKWWDENTSVRKTSETNSCGETNARCGSIVQFVCVLNAMRDLHEGGK